MTPPYTDLEDVLIDDPCHGGRCLADGSKTCIKHAKAGKPCNRCETPVALADAVIYLGAVWCEECFDELNAAVAS